MKILVGIPKEVLVEVGILESKIFAKWSVELEHDLVIGSFELSYQHLTYVLTKSWKLEEYLQ